jgi:tRNA uridine 5-carboxymethylaminomethyl modification enzyme
VLGKAIEHEYNLFDLLRRPGVTYEQLMSLDGGKYASGDVSRETLGDLSDPVVEQVEIAAKYAGYIDRQKDEVQRAAHLEKLRLPDDLDYMQVTALSIEVRQKLQKHRPETLGQASRISGVTPAAISLLMVHLKKGGFQRLCPRRWRGARMSDVLTERLRAGAQALALELDRCAARTALGIFGAAAKVEQGL